MNLNPRNWYYPQWITNIALIVFLYVLRNTNYILIGAHKYGGFTIFTVVGSILIIYAHAHNFGLESDMEIEQLLLKVFMGVGVIYFEIFLAIVLALVLNRVTYWGSMFTMTITLIVYLASVIFCYIKVETRSLTVDELMRELNDNIDLEEG